MNIVVLDGYLLNPGDNPWDPVAEFGDLAVHDRTAPEDVVARAAVADILLTNKVPLTAATIAQLPNLKFVSVLATGYDILDLPTLSAKGIPVSNVAGYSAESVAQHALALLLELTQHIDLHARATAAGEWNGPDFCFWRTAPLELAGKTLGIVGLGSIGRRMAALGHALGMTVIAHAPRPKDPPHYPGFAFVSREELFESADVVSLHCPLTPDNARFVNAALLARAKPGMILLNTARGGLIDEDALLAALESEKIGGAGLDTLSTEPPGPNHPLLCAPNCVVTPHMAWASLAARSRLMAETAANIRAFAAGTPRNVVNA